MQKGDVNWAQNVDYPTRKKHVFAYLSKLRCIRICTSSMTSSIFGDSSQRHFALFTVWAFHHINHPFLKFEGLTNSFDTRYHNSLNQYFFHCF